MTNRIHTLSVYLYYTPTFLFISLDIGNLWWLACWLIQVGWGTYLYPFKLVRTYFSRVVLFNLVGVGLGTS